MHTWEKYKVDGRAYKGFIFRCGCFSPALFPVSGILRDVCS